MRRLYLMILPLLCATAAWATDYNVKNDSELRAAIAENGANITVTADIDLSNSTLSIESGKTVSIDLNGHKLDRKLTKRGEGGGQVITVRSGGTLNLSNGTLKGGWGGAGGALVNEGGTVTLTDVTCSNNVADDRGGGICNREGGTLTMTRGAITDNRSNDQSGPKGGGGFFNEEGATATLTGVTITGNTAKLTGGGGICNFGTLTLDGCTITGNSANTSGGGIWQEGTLNMKGANTISGNTASSVSNNVYLRTSKVITVTGSLAGSSIGITMHTAGTFTSGFATYNSGTDLTTIFSSDNEAFRIVTQDGEGHFVVDYIKCRWDDKNKQVVNTTMTLTRLVGYNDTPAAGDYKEVKPVDGWFTLGGFSNDDEYYVVHGNVSHTTLNVLGKKVHLILCDGAKLTLSGGILCYNTDSNEPTLYIHCQSYGASMGKLDIASGYKTEAAGIGSDWDGNGTTGKRKAGNLEIHGGDLTVQGGKEAAGIGGGFKQEAGKITIYGGYIAAYGGEGTLLGKGGAGIGGGVEAGGGHVVIYDGKVYAIGRERAPGIGSGMHVYNDPTATNYPVDDTSRFFPSKDNRKYAISVVDIYGGDVEARGGYNSAGIGGGSDSNGLILNIYGGFVKAYGGEDGAGIGGGWGAYGGLTIIKGGRVYAYGGGNAAGIGSGTKSEQNYVKGGVLEVSGGHVQAYGGIDAAGIGGGEDADCGYVAISGGYVYAEGNDYGPGIGGGQDGKGGDVTITGGTVIAKAGRQARPEVETENRAIGPGEGCDDYGTLTIGNQMMVKAGYDGENYEPTFTAGLRVSACWYRSSARIEPCTHEDLTYTVSGTEENDTHTAHCKYCTTEFTPEQHDFSGGSTCSVCGVESTTTLYTVRTYLPTKVAGVYDGETYSCQTSQMASGTAFTMPDCPTIVPGLEFIGWEVSAVTSDPYTSTYTTTDGGTIKNAGDSYTISGNVSFIARYQNLNISLKDNESNGEILSTHDGLTAHSVTLTGRTLWKDDAWNTLCLPFSLASLTGTQLEGATLMEMDVDGWYEGSTRYAEEASGRRQTGFDNTDGTLYLYFKAASSIEAGKPYIIKWASGSHIQNPTFSNVTIDNTMANVVSEDGYFAFVGTYSPHVYTETNKSILFLGAENNLYYPKPSGENIPRVNACRAYFQLNGIEADDPENGVRSFVLNFEEGETTGIVSTTDRTDFTDKADAWYTVNGVKLSGKPTMKGVYIHGGRKVVIK